jgi:hypothetical protein
MIRPREEKDTKMRSSSSDKRRPDKRTFAALLVILALLLATSPILAGCSFAGDGQGANAPQGAGGTGGTGSTGNAGAAQADKPSQKPPSNSKALSEGEDLVIPTSEISTTAAFYPVTVNGTELEVLAVQAPDGSFRTAFNTCQVCYDSGRGYYEQEGDVLVCQNCGNRFKMDQVEVVEGGCNPVPIFSENKTETADSITIPYGYLAAATEIFSNWKVAY